MSYQPKTWENKPSTASPINATNLNHMEDGIKTNDDNIAGAQNAILTLQGEMLQAQGDISALETLVDSIFPVDTESGNPAVITDAFGGACKSLKLTLEPIQSGSGTPSPQNVRAIRGRTQSVVTRTGKNLCPLGSMSIVESENFNLKASTYTISFRLVGTGKYSTSRVIVYDSLNNEVGSVSTGQGTQGNTYSGQFTISEDKVCRIYLFNYNDSSGIYIDNIQIEVGSTATPYEAYTSETVTRTYGQTVYGGSDDVAGDGATSAKKLNEINGGFSVAASGVFYKDSITDISDTPTLCNIYPMGAAVQDAGGALDHPKTLCWQKWGLQSLRLCVYDSDFTDVAAFNTALAQTPMQVIFDLATPTSIPLTAQNITLLHGDNVLTTDADSIEASYSADIALYIDKKIAEGSNNNRSVDNSSMTKGGSGDEEVKEEEKKEEEEIEEPKKEETR